jgi:hypothetical protein
MLAHVIGYMVGAPGWGGYGRAHMPEQPQGLDAAKSYAPASSQPAANGDRGRVDAPTGPRAARFRQVRGCGTALTLQRRAARSAAPNRGSSGLLIAAALRRPSPRQQWVGFFMGQPLTSFVRTSAK